MKQYKIIQAYRATEELSKNNNHSTEVLWVFYNLRKRLLPHCEFQEEREKALKEKYSEYADEEGKIKGEPYKNYIKEFEELLNLEKDLGDIKKINLKLQDGMGITIQMMEALEDFVNFEK